MQSENTEQEKNSPQVTNSSQPRKNSFQKNKKQKRNYTEVELDLQFENSATLGQNLIRRNKPLIINQPAQVSCTRRF